MSFQNRIIQECVGGLDFADVGGLWGTLNEKVTVALAAGANRATMIDIVPPGHELWTKFEERASSLGCNQYGKFGAQNIDNADIVNSVGQYDFVHCAGILYHVPSPILTLERLHAITRKYLLLGSMVVPESISTPIGDLDFSGGRCVFIPALDEPTRNLVAAHFEERGLKIMHINHDESEPFKIGGQMNYGPWWWLYSSNTLVKLLEIAGFKVLEEGSDWDGRASYVFCERNQ